MKYDRVRILLPVISIAALALASCGTGAKAASINQLAPEVNTAVAETLTAEPTNTPTPTATSTPTETPTPTLTPTPTVTLTPVGGYYSSYPLPGSACYDSAYIADATIPDYSEIAPGEVFQKTWLLENTGTCAWASNDRMDFVSGYDMAGDPSNLHQIVEPGQEAYVTVSFTAPDVAGQYLSYWRLATRQGDTFGESVYVLINVPYNLVIAPTATSVPTNTPVAVATETMTPTPLPPTITPTPTPVQATSTPTPVPTPTETLTPTPPPTNTPAPTNTPTPTRDHRGHRNYGGH